MRYKQETPINVVQEIKSQTSENVLIVPILLAFLVWNLSLHLSQYTRNYHTNLKQYHAMFPAENCVLLKFQSFPRQRCVNEVLFIQGPFDKIQGLLGKIQGLFKDLSKSFNFQGLFKGLMLFQGLFKARANHVEP